VTSLTARVAALFIARPGEWIDGVELAATAGRYAWRTRLSELRRAPYHMDIRNRQRRLRRADGSSFIVSEYRFEMREEVRKARATTSEEIAAPALLF
jgi:hypothetical protein